MALSHNDRKWIEQHFSNLRELIVKNQVAIGVLETKAGIFGLIGGCIPIIIMIALYFLVK